MDGSPYLIHRDTLDSLDDKDFETARKEESMPRLPLRAQRGSIAQELMRGFEHVDSGLADMDFGGGDGPVGIARDATGAEMTVEKSAVAHTGTEDETEDLGMEKISEERSGNPEAAHIGT